MRKGITYTLDSNYIDKDKNALVTTGTADFDGEMVNFERVTDRKQSKDSTKIYSIVESVLTVVGKDFKAKVQRNGDIMLEGNNISPFPDLTLDELINLSDAEYEKIKNQNVLSKNLNALSVKLSASILTYWSAREDGEISAGNAEFLIFTHTYIDESRDAFVTEGKASFCNDLVDFKYTQEKYEDSRVSVIGKSFKAENFQFADIKLDDEMSGCPCSTKELEDRLKAIAFILNENVDCFWRENYEAHAAYAKYFGTDWVKPCGYVES